MKPLTHLLGRTCSLARVTAAGVLATCLGLRAQIWQLDANVAPAVVNDSDTLAWDSLTLQPYPDGKFLLTGQFFNTVDDVPSPRIARLSPGVTVDRGFQADIPANESIISAAPLANGAALVVIEERGYPGNPNGDESHQSLRFKIVRLRADGRHDSSYPPWDLRVPAALQALPGGGCIACGDFQWIGNIPRRGIARFSADGALDLAFTPTVALGLSSTVLPGPGGSLVVSDLGRVPFFARLRPDGSLDPTFTPGVRAGQQLIAVQPDGSVLLLVGATLIRVRGDGSPDPDYTLPPSLRPVRRAVPLSGGRIAVQGGETLQAFRTIVGPIHVLASTGAIERELKPTVRNGEFASIIAALPDDRLLVVEGSQVFSSPGGSWLVERSLVVLPTDGRAASAFPSRVTWRSASVVHGVAIDAGGRALIHGIFSHVDGRARPGLARVLPTGELDLSYAPAGLSHTLLLALPDGGAIVRREAITSSQSSNDSGLRVYGSQIVRLRADGTVDPTFTFSSLTTANPPGWLLTASDGRILVHHASLEWLAPDGGSSATLRTTFSGLASGTRPAVRLLANGQLLVGGKFTHVNGVAQPHLVRLFGDGTTDNTYAPDLSALLNIESAQPLPDGRAVVFGYVWIQGVFTPRALRLQPDGSVDRDYHLPVRAREGALLPDGSFVTPQRRFAADGRRDLNYATEIWSGNEAGTIEAAASAPDGSLWIGGRFDEITPHRRLALARFLPRERRAITVGPRATTVAHGGATRLQVATGTTETATYQWTHDGVAVPGATRAVLEFNLAKLADAGTYRALVTLGGHTLTSAPATLTVTPNTARLVNLSARSKVEPNAPQIAGFVCDAPGGLRPVLLRAVGFGLPGSTGTPMLPVPVLAVQDASRTLGTDRGSVNSPEVAALARTVGAFPITTEPLLNTTWIRGSGLTLAIGSGVFTATTTSGNGNSGLSLFEFYDASDLSHPPLARNLSIRGRTSPGVNVLTAGFVLAGNGPLRVLVRGIGPGLAAFGVINPVPDPLLRVYASGIAMPLAVNAAWAGDAALADASRRAGAFPLAVNNRDTAVLLTLEPGAYTVQLAGAAETPAEALIELYALDR